MRQTQRSPEGLENTALSALWYLYKAPQIADAFAIPALCVVFSSFLTGVVFMLMYYAFFHPNGPRFGQSPSCACEDPSAAFALPPDVATSTLRSISNNRSVAGDRDQIHVFLLVCSPVNRYYQHPRVIDEKVEEGRGS